MIVDGKAIAEQIYEKTRKRVELLGRAPILTIITCAPNFETQKYLALKERRASAVGIDTKILKLDESRTTEDFVTMVKEAVRVSDGIIVQLPLPPHVDTVAVVQSIPSSHDADALNPHTQRTLSPVVGSINEILLSHEVESAGKYVTIIGSGRLVGLPASQWFQTQGAYVSVVTRDTTDIAHYTKNADIIVCGAGVPKLLTPDMVKGGVVVLDAGTSEEGGVLMGDATREVAEKAALFTPVPGGIGPITIAVLLRNVVELAEAKMTVV